MITREERLRQVAQFTKEEGCAVSVKEIAEAMDLSKSYVRGLAKEAHERGLIHGEKRKPIIGYVFNEKGRARADGGRLESDLRVLTTREALLQAVRDYAPNRLSEARGKTLSELRKFVREEVADGTIVVERAWEFSPK